MLAGMSSTAPETEKHDSVYSDKKENASPAFSITTKAWDNEIEKDARAGEAPQYYSFLCRIGR